MKAKLKYYESIKHNYPDVVSKSQLCEIAHISKATALYLLQSGKIPCEDTGKKTRRYKIRTDDIIRYLIDRALYPEQYKAEPNWYQERSHKRLSNRKGIQIVSRNRIIIKAIDHPGDFEAYLLENLDDYRDLMTVKEFSAFFGYSVQTIQRWVREERFLTLRSRNTIWIPKSVAAAFLASEYACSIARKSIKHELILLSYLQP